MAEQKHSTHAISPDMIMEGTDLPFATRDDLRYHLEQSQQGSADTPAQRYARMAAAAGQGGTATDPYAAPNFDFSGDTELADYTKGFGKGTIDIVGSLAGVLEMTGAIDPGTLTKPIEAYAQEIVDGMSPSARENLERKWTELGPEGVLRNPKAALGQLSTVAPSVLASLLPAAAVASRVGKGAKALEGTAKAAKIAKAKSAGTAAGVGTEAAQIGGATYNEIRNTMDNMSHAELMEFSPQYKKKYKGWKDEASARREVLLDASRGPAALNALWGALVAWGPSSVAAGRGVGQRMGGNWKQRGAKGFAAEGAEEVGQEVPGAFITDIGMQQVDTRSDPTEGLGERAVSSFMLGAGVGGPTAIAFGGGDQQPADAGIDPAVTQALNLDAPEGPIEPTEFDAAPEPPIDPTAFDAPPIQPTPFDRQPSPGERPYQTGQADVTMPESVGDLLAQVWQVLQPGTKKQAVYLSPQDLDREGTMPEERLNNLNEGIMEMVTSIQDSGQHPNLDIRETSDGGMVIALDGALIDEYEAAGATDEARAKLLGYSAPKSGLQDPGTTVTVSKVNEDGTIAESHVVDNYDNLIAKAEDSYNEDLLPGQRVEVAPTGLALAERQQRVTTEISTGDQFSETRARTSTGMEPKEQLGADFDTTMTEGAHVQPSGLAQGTNLAPASRPTPQRDLHDVEEKPFREEPGQLELPVQQKQDPVVARRQNLARGDDQMDDALMSTQIQQIRDAQQAAFVPVVTGRQTDISDIGVAGEGTGKMKYKRSDKSKGAEAQSTKAATKGEELKTKRLFTKFERKFYEAIGLPLDERPLTLEQAQDIKAWLRSQAELTKIEGIAAMDVLHQINEILGGTNSELDQVNGFIGSEMKKGTPAPAPEEVVPDAAPVDNLTTEVFSPEEKRERAAGEAQRTVNKKRTKRAFREAGWEQQKDAGPRQPHPGLAQLGTKVGIVKAIRKVLMNAYGLSAKEAGRYMLGQKHFDFQLPLGSAEKTKSGRNTKFLKVVNQLQAAIESGDPLMLANLLTDRGIDTIAKTLVSASMKIYGKDVSNLIAQWRRKPDSVEFPPELAGRMQALYNRDVEKAFGMTAEEATRESELQALVDETYDEPTDATEVTGEAVDSIQTDIEGNVTDGQTPYTGEQNDAPKRTKSGTSTSTGTSSKPEKTAEQVAIDAVVAGARPESPATGDGSAGTGDDAGTAGELREPETVIGPEGAIPASISESVLENKYGFLGKAQREGVRMLLHRLGLKKSQTILNDGTGVGKTLQTLVAAREFSDRFEEKNGKKPKILIVVPNVSIGNNFVSDAKRQGLFDTTAGTSRKPGTIAGVDLVSYSNTGKLSIRSKAGQQYDLIIYDEAQKLGKPGKGPAKDAANIKATHVIYATATAGDKEENLGLIALMEGLSLIDFLRKFDPSIRLAKAEGSGEQVVDVTSIGNKMKFYTGLSNHMQGLANKFAYFRRAIPRRATVDLVTGFKQSTTNYRGSDGKTYSPQQMEKGLIRFYQTLGTTPRKGYRNTLSEMWDHSTKLAELMKLDEVMRQAEDAYKSKRKSIFLFYYQQDEFTVPVGVDSDGQVITVTAPSALAQSKALLEAEYPGEVVAIHGNKTSTNTFDAFQNGDAKVLVATYESVGTGHNLDDSRGPDTGAWGRQLVMVSPSWSADQQDQAEGRVERAQTKSVPKVVRLSIPEAQGDLTKEERLQMKEVLRDALRGQELSDSFGMAQNLRVEQDGDFTRVRIYALDNGSAPLVAIGKILKQVPGAEYDKTTRTWVLPKGTYTEAVQENIRAILDIASARPDASNNAEQVSTVETPAEPEMTVDEVLAAALSAGQKAKATSKTRTKTKAKAKPKAEAKPKARAKPKKSKIDRMDMNTAEARRAEVEELLTNPDLSYDKKVKLNNEMADLSSRIYELSSLQSVGSGTETGPFGGKGRDSIVSNYLKKLGLFKEVTAGTLLRKLARSKDNTPAQRRMLRRMAELIGGTTLEFTNAAHIAQMGLESSGGVYSSDSDKILIDEQEPNSETLVHEALHAVTVARVMRDPIFRGRIYEMIAKVAAIPVPDTFTDHDKMVLHEALHGTNSAYEFITYALTNAKIFELVDSIEIDNRSGMRKFMDWFLQAIGIHAPRQRETLADQLYDLVMEGMTDVRIGDRQIDLLKLKGADIAAPIVERIRESNMPQEGNQIMAAIRRVGLPLATLRQIETIYKEQLDKLATLVGANPVGDWADAMRRKGVTVKDYLTRGHKLHRDYMEVARDPQQREALETTIGESTLWNMWVNKSYDHADNKHLQYKKGKKGKDELLPASVRAKHKAVYDTIRAVYDAMGQPQRDMYTRLAKFYEGERTENFDLRIRNILYAFEATGARVTYLTDEGVETKISGDTAFREVSMGLRAKKPIYDTNNFSVKVKGKDGKWETDLRVNSMLAEALKADKSHTLANGPYFPLKRFGEWVVAGHRNEQTFTATLTDAEASELEAKYPESPAKVQQQKQKLLRKKLNNQRDNDSKLVQGHEADAVVYDGNTATQVTRERYVSMMESEAKALAEQKRIVADGWKAEKLDGTPLNVTRKISDVAGLRGNNAALLTHLRSKLGLGTTEGHPLLSALEASIIDMMPETAVHKELLKRQGVAGYNADAGRALASHIQSAAWYRGNLEHGKDISNAIAGMKEAQKTLRTEEATNYMQGEATKTDDVIREIQKHIQLDTNGATLHWATRKAGELGFLGLLVSPAYMAINALQPGMIGLPWLAAHSDGTGLGAAKALGLGYKTVSGEVLGRIKPGLKGLVKWNIDQELFDFLKVNADGTVGISDRLTDRIHELADTGEIVDPEGTINMLKTLSENDLLDFSLALDTSAAAEGKDQQNWWTRTMDVARMGPHLGEVLNRTVMAVSAYQMAVSQGVAAPAAIELAGKAVSETQFDYTMMNKPRWMSERQYELAKPVFMFMQHPQHVYALFVQHTIFGSKAVREVMRLRKAGEPVPAELMREVKTHFTVLFGVMGTHMLMGGATAMLFEPIKWALGLALMMFEAITGEPPEDTEVYMERWMQGIFGTGAMGEAAAFGLPTMIGIDIHNNVSLSNMIMYGGGKFNLDREGVEDTILSAMGPIPSVLANAAQGVSDIKDGDVLGGLSKMAPRMGRDFIRAIDAGKQGIRDNNGNELIGASELSPYDLFLMTNGIKPRKVTRMRTNKARIDAKKYEYHDQASRLRERLWRARDDRQQYRRVVADIREFNKTLPFNAQIKTTNSPSRKANQRMIDELGTVISKKQEWLAKEARVW